MVILKREELLKIFYYLAKTLIPQEIETLKKSAPGAWEDFSHLEGPKGSYSKWEIDNLCNVFAISYRIQEIVDARIGQHLRKVATFGDGLPKIYLAEIAYRFLELDITGRKKWELANDIMAKLNTLSSG